MIARIFVSANTEKRIEEVKLFLDQNNLPINHPDVLHLGNTEKIGIEQARQIKQHFALKPLQAKGKAVVIENGSSITPEAQNALLKTFEELPEYALLVLAADKTNYFLPTILSRCFIFDLDNTVADIAIPAKQQQNFEQLLAANYTARFTYIEKLSDKQLFLSKLITYFRQLLIQQTTGKEKPSSISVIELNQYVDLLLQAEQWVEHNVNIRAILEYLMLEMPFIEKK